MSLDQGAVESLPRGRGDLWRCDQADDEVVEKINGSESRDLVSFGC